MSNETIYKIVVAITTCIVAIAAAILLPSCSVSRQISYMQECVQVTDSCHRCATVISEEYRGIKKSSSHGF